MMQASRTRQKFYNIKIKYFFMKRPHKEMKRQAISREKICTKLRTDKGFNIQTV